MSHLENNCDFIEQFQRKACYHVCNCMHLHVFSHAKKNLLLTHKRCACSVYPHRGSFSLRQTAQFQRKALVCVTVCICMFSHTQKKNPLLTYKICLCSVQPHREPFSVETNSRQIPVQCHRPSQCQRESSKKFYDDLELLIEPP